MMKNLLIIGLLIAAVIAVVGIKNAKQEKAAAPGCAEGVCPQPDSPEKPIKGPSSIAAEQKKPDRLPKLLDLGAGTCIPCKMMAPILDEMKESFTGQLDVEFIDVWKNEEAGAQYGIRMIPTQIFFDADGRELFRHEGFFSREDMLAKWQELGFEFAAEE